MLTDQEVFDKVARHLLTQGKPAFVLADGLPSCRYRQGNSSCAVGCLIPDERYSPLFEGAAVPDDGRIISKKQEMLADSLQGIATNWKLLSRLQDVHDSGASHEEDLVRWPELLREVAQIFNLSPAVLDEFPNWQPKEAACPPAA